MAYENQLFEIEKHNRRYHLKPNSHSIYDSEVPIVYGAWNNW
jgi:hypothetical protein